MSKITLQAKELQQLLESVQKPIVELQKVDVPYTNIEYRAQMLDVSKDLKVKFGIDRFYTQEVIEMHTESGPSGQPVYKPVNDWADQARFVGPIERFNASHGIGILLKPGGYLEVSFYGTGINLLVLKSSADKDLVVSVDGGAYGADLYTSSSSVLLSRNYSVYNTITAVKGLSEGFHTVRMKCDEGSSNDLHVYGYEILSEGSELSITSGSSWVGGVKRTLNSDTTTSYNSGFDAASDAVGTKGGRAIVYQNEDGTIGKSFKAVGATASTNLGDVNHSEEEMIRKYCWREFGCGRYGDEGDFATLDTTITDRAYTLDDNSTSLSGNDVLQISNSSYDCLRMASLNDSIVLCFIGTGLDLEQMDNLGSVGDVVTVSVDGAVIGTIDSGKDSPTRIKICSNLPYGSHTVRLQVTTNGAGADFSLFNFYVYGPQKPTLSENAIELAEYFLMADFDGTTATGTDTSSNLQIPQGSISKSISREIIYVGSWTVYENTPEYQPHGLMAESTTNADYFEYTFFGTGISLHFRERTNPSTMDITIDGSLNDTGIGRVEFTNNGGGSYSTTAGGNNGQPQRLEFTGLSLGLHTIRATKTGGDSLSPVAFNIITPVHFPKNNGPHIIQNTLPIGSCSLGDRRNFSELIITKNEISCRSDMIASRTITGNADFIGDLFTTFYLEEDRFISVDLYNRLSSNVSGSEYFITVLLIDGFDPGWSFINNGNGAETSATNREGFVLKKGYHTLHWRYSINTSSGDLNNASRAIFKAIK
jgi:hypothetical protein